MSINCLSTRTPLGPIPRYRSVRPSYVTVAPGLKLRDFVQAPTPSPSKWPRPGESHTDLTWGGLVFIEATRACQDRCITWPKLFSIIETGHFCGLHQCIFCGLFNRVVVRMQRSHNNCVRMQRSHNNCETKLKVITVVSVYIVRLAGNIHSV